MKNNCPTARNETSEMSDQRIVYRNLERQTSLVFCEAEEGGWKQVAPIKAKIQYLLPTAKFSKSFM